MRYSYLIVNRFIRPIDEIQTDTNTSNHSEPGSNGNKEMILYSSERQNRSLTISCSLVVDIPF